MEEDFVDGPFLGLCDEMDAEVLLRESVVVGLTTSTVLLTSTTLGC